jgi:hypothetical protein
MSKEVANRQPFQCEAAGQLVATDGDYVEGLILIGMSGVFKNIGGRTIDFTNSD